MNDDHPRVEYEQSDESDARGYAAVVKAAGKLATSAIASREGRDLAEQFLLEEIERWSEGGAREFPTGRVAGGDDDGPGD